MAFGGVFHLEAVARRKLGVTGNPSFHFYRYERAPGGTDTYLLTGCITDAVYVRGPRKGTPKYDCAPMRAYVTDAEELAEVARYECEERKCARCLGEGTELAGFGVNIQTTYRQCGRCKGSGIPAGHSR